MSVFLYVTTFTVFSVGSTFLLLVTFVHTGVLFEFLLRWVCKLVIWSAGTRTTLEGTENFDKSKQYIVMMNHVNLFDGMLFSSCYPGKARAMEEESHFKWPIYGWLVKRMGFIPVNRKSGIKAMTALKQAAEMIKKRKTFSVVILPEGTRSRTGKLGKFKKGGFVTAIESGLDILPMIQVGAFHVKTKGRWLLRPGKVRVIIEKPIPIAGSTRENIEELMEKTRRVFLEYVQ